MIRPVVVLSLICLVASALLAGVNVVTTEPIAAAKKQQTLTALQEIFPFDIQKVNPVHDNDAVYYEVFSEKDTLRGVAVETFTEKGYGGRIAVLVGISRGNGTIYDYTIIETKETPGLGIKIADSEFRSQFAGKSLSNGFRWNVKKDGGDVDAVTAATISSRAIIDALTRGLSLFEKKYHG